METKIETENETSSDENEEAYRKGINVLLKLLTQDKIYYEQHKTILVRALKWQAQQKNTSILLIGFSKIIISSEQLRHLSLVLLSISIFHFLNSKYLLFSDLGMMYFSCLPLLSGIISPK